MSEKDQAKQDAAEHAARAAKQMKHAARNTGEAAESAAEYVKDEVVEGAVEAKSRLEKLAYQTVYSEMGQGAMMVGLGLISTIVGVKKIQNARLTRTTIRADLRRTKGTS